MEILEYFIYRLAAYLHLAGKFLMIWLIFLEFFNNCLFLIFLVEMYEEVDRIVAHNEMNLYKIIDQNTNIIL